jgi:hypothetical protein
LGLLIPHIFVVDFRNPVAPVAHRETLPKQLKSLSQEKRIKRWISARFTR